MSAAALSPHSSSVHVFSFEIHTNGKLYETYSSLLWTLVFPILFFIFFYFMPVETF